VREALFRLAREGDLEVHVSGSPPYRHVRALTSGFRRAPLAARRPASRCSVTRTLEVQCLETLLTANSSHSLIHH